MPKAINLSFEEVSEMLSYDPETGKIVWKITPSRRIKAGEEAGVVKHPNPKSENRYRYITMKGVSTPASRIAWLLHYRFWPTDSVKYKDGDTLNTRIANLEAPMFPAVVEMKGDRRVYKMSKDAQRHYGLKRYYGLSGEEYGQMLADQKGVCAICNKPETAMFNGQPKVMHVDHCHATNQIRALLCGSCNGMLGLAKDSPDTLRAAADYIEKHAAKTVFRVIEGSRKPDTEKDPE